MITDVEIKEKWFKFFEKHGFKRVEGYSIIPENDPTILHNCGDASACALSFGRKASGWKQNL